MHLFSARVEQVRYGAEHYRQRSDETSTMLKELFNRYQVEASIMSDALEEFTRQKREEILQEIATELSLRQLLSILTPEKRAEMARLLREEESSSATDRGTPQPDDAQP